MYLRPHHPLPNPTIPYWRNSSSHDPSDGNAPISPSSPSSSSSPFHLHSLDSHRSTPDLPEKQDILIIGAGFAGVALAHYLVEEAEAAKTSASASASVPQPPSITILEARETCSGATGRNGGHLRPVTFTGNGISVGSPNSSSDAAATRQTDMVARFEVVNAEAVAELVESKRIDCDFRIVDTADVFINDDEEDEEAAEGEGKRSKAVTKARELWASLMEGYDEDGGKNSDGQAEGKKKTAVGDGLMGIEFIEGREEAERISGVPGARALVRWKAATMWPYKFITSLLAPLVNSGAVNLQTHRPVLSIAPPQSDEGEDDGVAGYWTVTVAPDDESNTKFFRTKPTPSLPSRPVTTKARTVIVATNGHTPDLLPESYGNVITPVRGICGRVVVPHLSPPPSRNLKSASDSKSQPSGAREAPLLGSAAHCFVDPSADLDAGPKMRDYYHIRPSNFTGGGIEGGKGEEKETAIEAQSTTFIVGPTSSSLGLDPYTQWRNIGWDGIEEEEEEGGEAENDQGGTEHGEGEEKDVEGVGNLTQRRILGRARRYLEGWAEMTFGGNESDSGGDGAGDDDALNADLNQPQQSQEEEETDTKKGDEKAGRKKKKKKRNMTMLDTKRARVEEVWSGIMGFTHDSLPHLGRVPVTTTKRGLYICAGFSGHGMPLVLLSARGVARLVMRNDYHHYHHYRHDHGHGGKNGGGKSEEGYTLADDGVPACFETSLARIDAANAAAAAAVDDDLDGGGGGGGASV